MDSNAINEVLDKAAEKLGLAVEQLQPLAETVIREFAAKSVVGAVVSGILALLAIVAVCICAKRIVATTAAEKFTEADGASCVIHGIVGVVSLVAFFPAICSATGHAQAAVSPTYTCLRMLLR